MPAMRSAPRSKVAPCTARFANQPSTQPTPSIVKAAPTVRSKVGILPHTRKCVAFAKTILGGARRRQALDGDGPPAAATATAGPTAIGQGLGSRKCHLRLELRPGARPRGTLRPPCAPYQRHNGAARHPTEQAAATKPA